MSDIAATRKEIMDSLVNHEETYGAMKKEVENLLSTLEKEASQRPSLPKGADPFGACYRMGIEALSDIADFHRDRVNHPGNDEAVSNLHKGQEDLMRYVIKILRKSLEGDFSHLNRENLRG